MPTITSLNPSVGWPGGTRADGTVALGTQVIIRGTGFHPTPEMDRNQVTFAGAGGSRIPAPVEWASFNEIDYQSDGVIVRNSNVPGSMDGPMGVAIDGTGTLFIADTGNHRILRRTAGGDVSAFGGLGAAAAQFNHPNGVGVDSQGFVYVADTMNHRIQKFDNNGTFVAAWGSQGNGNGEFDMPVAVDILEFAGLTLVYVADSNNRRIVRTDGDGGMPTQFLTPPDAGRILGVCAGRPYGFVYGTDSMRRRIYRWTWAGGFYSIFGSPRQAGDVEVELDFPMGIAQDFDGFVYVADNGARIIRKFDGLDPTFREVARFGLTPSNVAQPTPEDQFVDPVAVAVTDLKAAVIVDRQREHVIRYIPTDAQEIWVHVPEGAVGGTLEVRTDDGVAASSFSVFEQGDVEIVDAYMSQQLVEHPFVAGKDTVIRYQARTLNAPQLENFFWGSPVTDSAVCAVSRDGQAVGNVDGTPVFITGSGGFMSFDIAFELQFRIPFFMVNDPGHYTFTVTMDRTGAPAFHDERTFEADVVNRLRYRIINAPISHLNVEGNRVRDTGSNVALFAMDPRHSIDWLDFQQLYSGYAHYNRMYPLRRAIAEIEDYYTWIDGGLEDGVSGSATDNPEVEDMLGVLERTRRRLNETASPNYDFMLGTLSRGEIGGGAGRFIGITSPDIGHACLISVGINTQLDVPAFDVGGIISHELLHQHGVNHQTDHEFAPSAKDAWDSITGFFDRTPVTLMFTGAATVTRFDFNVFPEAGGEYDTVFDALANPHPKRMVRREKPMKDLPRTFSLVGWIRRDGGFDRSDSWIGSAQSPVTLPHDDGDAALVCIDGSGRELLRWGMPVTFGLVAITAKGETEHREGRRALVSATVPFPDGTARVALTYKGRALWEGAVPAAPPEGRLTAPTSSSLPPGKPVRVAWTTKNDARATVSVSTDGGQTFRPIALNVGGHEVEIPAVASGSGRVRIRVDLSDGFFETPLVTDDIEVGPVPTHLAITQPWRGAVIPQGQRIRLSAMAINADTGPVNLTGGNTIWDLDGEVILGSGNGIEVGDLALRTPLGDLSAPLPAGTHELRVRVTIAPGQVLEDAIPIQIAADADRDGIPDDVERQHGTDPNNPGDGAAQGRAVPFGQWSFEGDRQWTEYEIGHLNHGTAVVEIGFIAEDGSPLANHPVALTPAPQVAVVTSARGVARVTLGALASVKVAIASAPAKAAGFGIAYARLAPGSPMHDTQVVAHAWIVRQSKDAGRLVTESQGTVVISGGRPVRLLGPAPKPAPTSGAKKPGKGHRTLGFLAMAKGRRQHDAHYGVRDGDITR